MPITEAYIDCCRYELEKLGFTLIIVNREYLVCATEDLSTVRLIDDDNAEVYLLAESELNAKVGDFLEGRKNKMPKESNKDKLITEDKLLILKDIWVKLIAHN